VSDESNVHGSARPVGVVRDAVYFSRNLAAGVVAWGNDLYEVARELSEATGDTRRSFLLRTAAECDEFSAIARDVSAKLRSMADGE